MQKEQDVVRLAKWMTEHPKIRRRICEDEYMVSPEEFIDIMELLEKNEFYEMISMCFSSEIRRIPYWSRPHPESSWKALVKNGNGWGRRRCAGS